MDILIKAGQLILALAILVTVHEFGHFFAARFFKTRVEKFYLFFNPWFSLYKKKIGDTEWGIGWLPLGGYVKISGMIDESMDVEQMKQEPKPWEFRSKPAWQRLIIMLGGIIVNLILGYLIYICLIMFNGTSEIKSTTGANPVVVGEVLKKYGFQNGDEVLAIEAGKAFTVETLRQEIMLRGTREFEVKHVDGTTQKITLPEDVEYEIFQTDGMNTISRRMMPVIGEVVDTMPAAKAGIKKGDIITAVDGKTIQYWDEMTDLIKSKEGEEITLSLNRKGEKLEKQVQVDTSGFVGIQVSSDLAIHGLKVQEFQYGFLAAISAGISTGNTTLTDYVASLKFIFTKKGATGLGGVGTIANLYGSTWDWTTFWTTTAFLSFMLAFLNLLPIPALDGGHVLFLLVEMVTGRALPQRFLEFAQMIGFFLLLGLILYANGLDLLRGLGFW